MPILSEHVQGENQNIVQKMRNVKQNLAMKGFKKSSYLGILVVLALVVTTVALGPRVLERQKFERSQAAAPDVVIKPEVTQKVAAQGKARVIVSLNTSKIPEGEPNSSAVVTQKNQIKSYQDQLTAALAGLEYRVINKYDNLPYINIEVNQAALTKLQTLKGIAVTVEEDKVGSPIIFDVRNIEGVDALQTQNPNANGAGQIVVVIDTGVNSSHEYLQGKVIDEVCFGECPAGAQGPGTAQPCTKWPDVCDHGTNVAGVIAGNRIENVDYQGDGTVDAAYMSGVAPGASIISIRVSSEVCDLSGCDPQMRFQEGDILAALNWVVNNRSNYPNKFIAAVNMSFRSNFNLYSGDCSNELPAFRDALALLKGAHIAPVAGAGNDGNTTSLISPACISSAIPVGNVTKTDTINATSNVGSLASFPNLLLATGTEVATAGSVKHWDIKSGTSIGAPVVSAAFAIMQSINPFSEVDSLIDRLKNTGVSIADTRAGSLGQLYPRIEIDGATLTNTVNGKALNFDYPVKSGNNRVLVVSAAYQHGSVADLNNTRLTGVTYGGAAMQPLFAISPTNPRANVSSFTDPSGVARNTEIWYLVNPPVGTQQINATFGADPGEKNLMATTLFDVDFTSPFGVVGKTSAAGTTIDPTRIGFPANGYGGSLANADLPGCDTTAKCKLLSVFATDLSNGTNPAKAAASVDTFTKQPVTGLYSKQTFTTAAGESGKLGVLLATSEGIDKVTSSGDAIQTMLRTPKRLGFSSVGFFWKELKTASSPVPTPTPLLTPSPSPTLATRGTPPPPMKGWTASYYPNTTFTGGSNSLSNLIGTVGSVNFDWGTGNPVGKYGPSFSLTFPSDNFSANFSGRISPTVSGTYSFKTDADNTAVFTITNGSGVETTVINGGGIRTATYAMTAGQTYTLNVKYTELTGSAKMKLFWKTPGTTTFVALPAESMAPVDNSWLLLLSSGTYSIVGLPPQNSCEHTVRFVNKPNDGVQNVMDVDAIVENYMVIEEDSPRLKRDTAATWTQTCGGAASGDCLYYTRNSGLGFEFKTTAQKITYLGRKGDKQGSMQMYIDGVLKFTQNRYATSYIGQQPIDISLTNLTCPSGATPTPVPPPPPPAAAPVVNLTANGSGGPITVAANSSVTLAWSTSNATSCSAAATVATTNWSGAKAISGAQAVTIGTSRTLSLTCTGSGGTTTDSVVVNVSSTATPTPPPVTSQSVYLSFDGVDDSATVLNSTSLNLPSSDVSMSLWVNRGSGGGAVQNLMGKGFGTASSYGIDLENGVPRVGIRSDLGLATLSDAAVVVPSGVWTHVGVSIDDTGSGVVASLYINGVLMWTKTSTIRIGSSTSNLFIGQRPGGGNYFKGFLDDVRVYQRVLSASEMSTLNAKGNPSTTNLKAQFRFNEASEQTLIDSSTSGNTGFLGATVNVETSDPVRGSGGIN